MKPEPSSSELSLSTVPWRPRIGLTFGDPAGIGPEVVRAALADTELAERVRFVAIGPAREWPAGARSWDPRDPRDRAALAGETALFLDSGGPHEHTLGAPQAACGRAALDALRAGHELAVAGDVDALVTAPVSKEALALAGEPVEGQTQLLARWSNAPRTQMMAIAGNLRVLLLTRHIPLAQAIKAITTQAVVEHLEMLNAALLDFGFAAPRLALAGLNPHAGEAGLLGREEIEILAPAVLTARARGIDVSGPLSPDTVFQSASRGRFDAVLALYHDQAFIPVKLLDPDGGLTVLLGLPYLRVSPAHGTAFDIAGRGIASAASLIGAVRQAAAWASARHAAQKGSSA